jgi:DNA ligase 1
MPPKGKGTDSPSPSKKRRTQTTPVKRGVDFFFKKQAEKGQLPPASSNESPPLFVQSDDENGWDSNRRKQEEEDERLARELQNMEDRVEFGDDEFARRLVEDYKSLESDTNKKTIGKQPSREPQDLNGSKQLPGPSTPIKGAVNMPLESPPQLAKLSINNPTSIISLEEIYAIPLDKDPLQFDPATDASCASHWSPQKTPYAFLTHAFILINSTRSRLKIVDYLVNALRVVTYHDPASLLPLVWLTTNAIAPPFEGVELGLGGSVISKALISASGLNSGALKSLYGKHGDIGDVAFEAKMAVRTLITPTPLTVKGVYATLQSIARAKGQGSMETKRRLVERLLVSAKGEEVRYIGRTLVQNVISPLKILEGNGSYGLAQSRRRC